MDEISKSTELKFENVLLAIKPFGKWQFSVVLTVSLILAVQGFTVGMVVFTFLTPKHNCRQPEMNSVSADQCFWSRNSSESFGNSSLERCQEWLFDADVMEKTVVTQWNLVCNDQLYAAHGITVKLLGWLFGASIGGYLGDKYGRKTVMVIASFLCGIFGVLQAYVPIFWAFLLFRFLTGMAHMALMMVSCVLENEVTTAKYRVLIAGTWVSFSIGGALCSPAAYFIWDWRHLLAVAHLPFILLSLFVWAFLHESPRWLLSKGNVSRGREVIEKAAKCNGVTLPTELELESLAAVIHQEEKSDEYNLGFLHIYQYPALLWRTLNLIFCWSVNTMVYYGLMLNIVDFSGDLLLNNALNGLVEIPCFFVLVALTSWSRKKPLVFFLLFAGLSVIIIPWIHHDTVKLVLAFAGKFGITLTFNIVYLYTMELYPTSVRSSALGACSMASRISSMLAPYIALISVWNPALKWVPMTVYGSAATVSGLLVCLAPETAGKRLPETFKDALRL